MRILFFKYIAIWAWGFSLSLLIYPLYTEGDLVIYREYYSLITDLNSDNLLAVMGFFGSYDIVFPIFYLPFAYIGLSHYWANSIINGYFCVLLYKILYKYKVSGSVIILIFSNYYTLVLLFPAERSKVAFVFVMLAILAKGWSVYKYFILSIFSHLQSVFYALSIYSSMQVEFVRKVINGKIPKRRLLLISCFILFVCVFLWIFYPVVSYKLEIYNSSLIDDIPKSLMLFGVACYLSKERLRMVLLSIPLLFGILLLGGESRLYMISFYSIFYILIKYGVVSNGVFYCWLVFYSLKSYSFIYNTLVSGQGFG
jgi:hypothetical protein